MGPGSRLAGCRRPSRDERRGHVNGNCIDRGVLVVVCVGRAAEQARGSDTEHGSQDRLVTMTDGGRARGRRVWRGRRRHGRRRGLLVAAALLVADGLVVVARQVGIQ